LAERERAVAERERAVDERELALVEREKGIAAVEEQNQGIYKGATFLMLELVEKQNEIEKLMAINDLLLDSNESFSNELEESKDRVLYMKREIRSLRWRLSKLNSNIRKFNEAKKETDKRHWDADDPNRPRSGIGNLHRGGIGN